MAPTPRVSVSIVAILCALLLSGVPNALALLNIDGTRNQVFVFGTLTVGYNSNIDAVAGGAEDTTLTFQAGAELKRKAGTIGVTANAQADFIRYQDHTEEDAINPRFGLAFNKESGRTTGTLTLQAYRESRSDSAVNLLTTSWNYPIDLNLRYPINEKFYITSHSSYVETEYVENENLVDYRDIAEALDLYYTYTSKLDLLAGYRIRVSHTAVHDRTLDHWFSVGATGGILPKLTGTVRIGYQLRQVQGTGGGDYGHFTAMAALDWPLTRKLSLALSLNRDFNTIATGESVDALVGDLSATYLYSSKLEIVSHLSGGINEFLSDISQDRRDTFATWGLSGNYRLNDHFRMGASYSYFRNWSSQAFADYDSHVFTVDLTGRY
jgi:hypothetical protein